MLYRGFLAIKIKSNEALLDKFFSSILTLHEHKFFCLKLHFIVDLH